MMLGSDGAAGHIERVASGPTAVERMVMVIGTSRCRLRPGRLLGQPRPQQGNLTTPP